MPAGRARAVLNGHGQRKHNLHGQLQCKLLYAYSRQEWNWWRLVTATGINCGADCSELYAGGTLVTLTAIPAGGSSFAGWSGTGWSGSGCQGTAGCTMTISSNTAVTATFVNNQADKVGIYRPSTGEWFLDQNGDGCSTDKCVRSLATAGAVPVVGDWNRSGVTLLGLFLPATAQWRLDINGNDTLEDCGIDNCFGPFGQGTDIPIAGKWSSTGYDRIGVFRPSNERWYMDVNGNGSLKQLQQGSMRQSVCLSGWGFTGNR